MDIDEGSVDSIPFQLLQCPMGKNGHHSCGHYGHVFSFLQNLDLSRNHFVLFFRYVLHRLTGSPEIDRSLDVIHDTGHLLRLVCIAGLKHNHSRNGAHCCNVLHSLMGSSVSCCSDSSMASDYLDVKVRVGHSIPDDFVCSSTGEYGHG